MRSNLREKSDIFSAQEFIVAEWFYLCRWRESRKPIWAVVDIVSKEIIYDLLTRYQAIDMSLEQNITGRETIIVNNKDPLYSRIKLKNGVCDEDFDLGRFENS